METKYQSPGTLTKTNDGPCPITAPCRRETRTDECDASCQAMEAGPHAGSAPDAGPSRARPAKQPPASSPRLRPLRAFAAAAARSREFLRLRDDVLADLIALQGLADALGAENEALRVGRAGEAWLFVLAGQDGSPLRVLVTQAPPEEVVPFLSLVWPPDLVRVIAVARGALFSGPSVGLAALCPPPSLERAFDHELELSPAIAAEILDGWEAAGVEAPESLRSLLKIARSSGRR